MESDRERGQKWASILQKLTSSKSSILEAATFVLSQPGQADELLGALLARTRECPPQQRLKSLCLVDAICSRSAPAAENKTDLVRVAAGWLPDILKSVLSTESEGESEGASGSNLRSVRNFVSTWSKKQLFEPAVLDSARALLQEVDPAAAAPSSSAGGSGGGGDRGASTGKSGGNRAAADQPTERSSGSSRICASSIGTAPSLTIASATRRRSSPPALSAARRMAISRSKQLSKW